MLASRRRLQVLQLPAGGRELAVTTVDRRLEIATPVASQSVHALESRGLVQREQGRWGTTPPAAPFAAALVRVAVG